MSTIILVIHVFIAVALIIVVLLQRSEGGALGSLGGGGGGGGGFGGLMSGRQSANLLTRATTILAACFMGTSLLLAILASRQTEAPSIMDDEAPLSTPAPTPQPAEPEQPSAPSAPVVD